jgi:SET and MYND domain-containing protein
MAAYAAIKADQEQLRINCVPLRSPSKRDPVGYAFDVVTAMINHSCDPNAHVFFEGDQLRVRSLKDIAAGEEITISYVPPMLNVANRKILLDHMFFFDCYCESCEPEPTFFFAN